jgi:hypothetical protein
MELERLELALRRRTPWEAADLGLPLLRRWRGAAYRAWFATFLPFVLLVFLALAQWPLLAALVVWWCKPLFDRVLLKVYSEAVFGEPPSVREVWRALPGLLRGSGLLWSLTLGRADMARSFHLPIRQLEGQRGPAARARRRVLDRKARGCAVWLTLLCAHASAFLQISPILLLDFLWPNEAPPVFDWEALLRGEGSLWQSLLSHLAWLFGETLVEPFYVAAGFTLYLNRRNELEGWDIELGFRRLTRRFEAERRTAAWAGLGLAGLLLVQFPGEGYAAPAEPPAQSATAAAEPSAAKRAVTAVLEDPVFGHRVPDWEWRYRGEEKTPKHDDPSHASAIAEALAQWLAQGVRLLSYLGGAALAVAFIVLLYRHRGAWQSLRPPARAVPATLFGLDLRPDSLPVDVAGEAARLLAAGAMLPALSLLYRGALVSLIHAAEVDFRPGDTEGDCRGRVRGRVDAAAEHYFGELLDAWSLAAYARAAPPAERLRALCLDWPRHFAAPRGPAA